MRTMSRRLPVAIAFAATGILATSVAVAAWTATGTGETTATAGSAVELEVSGVAVDDLFPTTTSDVTITVTNPNPYDVTISDVVFAVTETTAVGCDPTTVSFTDQSGLTFVVGTGATETITFSDAAAMSNAATDACQGAEFTSDATASGLSS